MYEEYADNLDSMNVFPEGKTFRISYDSTVNNMRITSKSQEAFDEIREAFSVENKAAFFSRQYGYKSETRLYNINKFGYFLPGLVYDILGWIKTQYGYLGCVAVSSKCAQYMETVLKPLKKVFSEKFELSNITFDTGISQKMEMRPYQYRAVESLMFQGYGRGLIEIPTAGGKSFIISNFIWNLFKHVDKKLKSMILVPNVQLVEQFYSDLISYGFHKEQLAKFEGGMTKREQKENDVNTASIIIANRQFLFKNEKALPPVDVLICDECHTSLAESSQALISRIPAEIRVGCSGTIPNDKYQRNQLIGMFGRLLYKEDISALQDEGFISKIKIISVEVFDRQVEANRDLLFHIHSNKKYIADDPEGCDIKFDDAIKAEHEYAAKWYNDLYAPVLDMVSKLEGNTLVLFDKIDVGCGLYKMFAEKYPNIKSFYNDGSTKVKEREDTRTGLEETAGNVLFANVQILSTGTNIKRLHNLVFCFSSKSTVRIIQSCGRALRLYSDKTYANLYDVHFNYKYSDRHYRERLRLYREYYKKSKPDAVIKFII